MFFVFSKVLAFLIYPLSFFLLLLWGVFLCYHQKQARRVLAVALSGLYILSAPFPVNYFMHWLEGPPPSPTTFRPPYEVVVVLSGMVNLGLSREDWIEFNEGVDRILTGISLIKQGLGEKLLISGGSGSLFDQSLKEAELLKKFSIEWGLSADQVLVEATSRNTYENAVHSAEIIRPQNFQRILLITSASHMRRAAAAFHKQGIFPDLYPVDFSAQIDTVTLWSFFPSAIALNMSTRLIHELVGIVMYRVQGYI